MSELPTIHPRPFTALRIVAGTDPMRICRSHPVLSSAMLGAVIGATMTVGLMITVGYIGVVTNGVLLILWPTSVFGVGFLDGSRSFEVVLWVAEVGGNGLLYAAVFSAPVAFVLAIRRSFVAPEVPTSIGRS